MKLLYATSIHYPSPRANRIQVRSMARALSKVLKENFMLGVGRYRDTKPLGSSFVEMGIHRSYALAWRYIRYALREGYDHIYCREERLLFFMVLYAKLLSRTNLTFTYEVHHLTHARTWWHRFMLSGTDRIVSITASMKDWLVRAGYPAERILVAPDSVDLSAFAHLPSKEEARRSLGLPLDPPIVLYAGTIDEPWKGVGVLYESVAHTARACQFVVVGGKPHYVDEFRETHPDIPRFLMLGHKPHADIALYMAAADVLVLPNSGMAEISRIATSPMKLFEYMAAHRPIVASDLPSIREILNDENAFLVRPDDPQALARGIDEALADARAAEARAHKARSEVERYTWDARAASVLGSIA